MCGIVSIFSYNSPEGVDRRELLRIRDYMTKRGPDGDGEWYSKDNRVGLGHRRLAIIDLSESGAQPMQTADGRYVISFNGEIYNYQALRAGLQARGYRFKSTSDTEVLLQLYADKGPEMLNELRGMFAFVIWDNVKRELFLARDPFGIKPLYYSDDGNTFRVASQVKALLAGGRIDTNPEPAGHVGFFLWGHVPGPYTLYKGIRSLPAGSFILVDQTGQRSLKSYCSVTGIFTDAEKSKVDLNKEEVQERLRDALLDAVRHHLIADVPVGVFLSAGMDSTTLVALATELKRTRLNTVTLGFREYIDTHDDETPLATLVADCCHTEHQTVWVSKEDFHNELTQLLDDMDQPTTDGVNSYFVSKAAVKAGLKVAISGLGGDELFGSYPSFSEIPKMVRVFEPVRNVPVLGKAFRVISAPLLKHLTSPKYAGLFEYGGSYAGAYLLRRGMFMPWELPGLLDGEMVREGWGELQTMLRLGDTVDGIGSEYLKVAALEMCWYMRNQLLRDTDWASMAHSLEVRVPLVDVNLLHVLSPLLSSSCRPTKADMASTPRDPLPSEIINRGKTGFSVPMQEWLMRDYEEDSERGLRGWARRVYDECGKENAAFPSNRNKKARSLSPRRVPAILIFRTGQLGDTLVAMPAIRSIRKKYPRHRLILLTDRHSSNSGYVSSWDLFGPTGWFDDVLFYTPSTGALDTFKNMSSLARKLRKLSPEYIFDLSPDRTEWQRRRDRFFFQHMAGISHHRRREAFRLPERKRGCELPRLEPEWLRLLSVVGGAEASDRFRLFIPEKEREQAERILVTEGINPEKILLAVGPGSKMPAKRWPKGRFAELGSRLLRAFPDVELLVLGGQEDVGLGDELCRLWGRCAYNLAGKLSPYGSAVALEKCLAYVGNDTGTMHLAAMVGTPCVAIFSARDYPGKWEPYGEGHEVLRHELECSGCMLESCDSYSNECLTRITVDEVFSAVDMIVTASRSDDRSRTAK